MAGKDKSDGGNGLAGGLEIAAGVGLGALAGNWIDHKYKIAPWGILIGAGVGFAGGMYLLIKELFRSNKN